MHIACGRHVSSPSSKSTPVRGTRQDPYEPTGIESTIARFFSPVNWLAALKPEALSIGNSSQDLLESDRRIDSEKKVVCLRDEVVGAQFEALTRDVEECSQSLSELFPDADTTEP